MAKLVVLKSGEKILASTFSTILDFIVQSHHENPQQTDKLIETALSSQNDIMPAHISSSLLGGISWKLFKDIIHTGISKTEPEIVFDSVLLHPEILSNSIVLSELKLVSYLSANYVVGTGMLTDTFVPAASAAVTVSAATGATNDSSSLIASFAAKSLEFLAHHQYETLFVTALIGFGIYDYYHENQISNTIKNNVVSFWKNAVTPLETIEAEEDKDIDESVALVLK